MMYVLETRMYFEVDYSNHELVGSGLSNHRLTFGRFYS